MGRRVLIWTGTEWVDAPDPLSLGQYGIRVVDPDAQPSQSTKPVVIPLREIK